MKEQTIHEIWKFAEEIQPVYDLLKWKWSKLSGNQTPSVKDIVDSTKHLVQTLLDSPDSLSVQTGGLYAERLIAEGEIRFGFISSGYTFYETLG